MKFDDLVFVYHLNDERQLAWHGRKHVHPPDLFELHYFISGTGCFQNGNTIWSITPGSLYLTPPGMMHQILASDEKKPITYYAVLFDASNDEELGHLLKRLTLHREPFNVGTSRRFFFANLLERHFSKKDDLILAAHHNFIAFLYDISAGSAPQGPLDNAHVEKAIAIMQMSIEKKLSLSTLCDRLQLSHEHFIRVFTDRMRIPPMHYYVQLKMEAARAMLSSTNLRIHEIADKLGFESQFSFTRTFKRHTQLSPSEFRAQCLQRADFTQDLQG